MVTVEEIAHPSITQKHCVYKYIYFSELCSDSHWGIDIMIATSPDSWPFSGALPHILAGGKVNTVHT